MKNIQRLDCLRKRNELNIALRNKYNLIISLRLKEYLINKKNIMSYKSIKSEVDITLFNKSYNDLAYPIIIEEGIMEAHISSSFKKGLYNIDEPYNGIKIDPKDLEYIIVPLVGFDIYKNRLGYGKGYYDRFLKQTNAYKIGVAYEIQKVDKIIISENDIPLDMIITEKEIYY